MEELNLPEPIVNPSSAREALEELSRVARDAAQILPALVQRAGALTADSLKSGGKVLACGNGGSAADAQHFVAEFVGHMAFDRRPLPAITLNVDPSVVTSITNDYGFEQVFARQVEGLGKPGDILFALTTSGKSRNVIAALDSARKKGLKTVVLTGDHDTPELDQFDVVMRVPSLSTIRIQEIHMNLLHEVCSVTESLMFD